VTVLEPMPDGPARRGLLRRAAFGASALGLTCAFVLSLSGIASTQGRLKPNGQAAAAIQARQAARTGDAAAHRGCHREGRTRATSRPV
jgi:hypothetical protein